MRLGLCEVSEGAGRSQSFFGVERLIGELDEGLRMFLACAGLSDADT